jgi:hypothetical protein
MLVSTAFQRTEESQTVERPLAFSLVPLYLWNTWLGR